MGGYYLSREEAGGNALCISMLARRVAEAAGLDWAEAFGYYLYRRGLDGDDITILAHLDSEGRRFRPRGHAEAQLAARCQYPFQVRLTGASIAAATILRAAPPLSSRRLSSNHAAWFAYWCR